MSKDEILDKLSKMPLFELDQKLQTKNLEMRDMLTELAKCRDEELVYKHDLRKKLLAENHSFGKVENMLRSDNFLYAMKRKIMALATNKRKLGIEIDIVKNFYWSTKNIGG